MKESLNRVRRYGSWSATRIATPCDVSGYVFLAQVGDFVIASPYINDHDELDYLMEYRRRETCEDYDADLPVFYADDCFATREAAREALEGWFAE